MSLSICPKCDEQRMGNNDEGCDACGYGQACYSCKDKNERIYELENEIENLQAQIDKLARAPG